MVCLELSEITITGHTKSFQQAINTRIPTVAYTGFARGTTSWKKVLIALAPSSLAAYSILSGIPIKFCLNRKIYIGLAIAGSISAR